MDGQFLRSNNQVTLDTAMSDFNSNYEWRKWPLELISIYLCMPFWLPSYSVPKNRHMFVQ